MGAGLLFTGSKLNLALAIVIVPTILFWLPAREGRVARASKGLIAGALAIFIGLLAGIYYLQTFNSYYYEQLTSFISDPNDSDSTTSRLTMWEDAVDCGLTNPLFGIGGGNAGVCVPYSHAHNVFLNYFLEIGLTGFVGIIVFFWTCVYILTLAGRACDRQIRRSADVVLSYRAIGLLILAELAFIVSNSSSDSLSTATMPTFWMFVALSVALQNVIRFAQDRE